MGKETPAKRRPRGVPAMGRPAVIVGERLDVSQALTHKQHVSVGQVGQCRTRG